MSCIYSMLTMSLLLPTTITIVVLVLLVSVLPSAYSLSNGKPNFQDIVSKMRADLPQPPANSSPPSPSKSDASPPSCVAHEARSLNLFSTTPLIHSAPLSRLCHPHPVYLKLDLLQPSGSFKDRGMAHLCTTVQKMHNTANSDATTDRMKVISSSGGNAGLAVTTVARNIPQMDVSVIVPETTKPLVVEKLRSLGAEVTIHGKNWNAADALARQWVDDAKKSGGGAVYVSPYDNP